MPQIGKRAVFDQEVIDNARKVVKNAIKGNEAVMAIAVLMAGVLKLTSEQIGDVLGVSVPTVIRMNARFRKGDVEPRKCWGGDRNSKLSREEQAEVLESLKARAACGEVVLVSQVKEALEEKAGGVISLQTAYNVLHRNGWRKVAPDKEHPKRDPKAQEEFKKNSSRKSCLWLPPKHTA